MKTISIIIFFALLFFAKAQEASSGGLRGNSFNVDSSTTVASATDITVAENTVNTDKAKAEKGENRSVLITIQYDSKFQVETHEFELIENRADGWNTRMRGHFPWSGFVARKCNNLHSGGRYTFLMKPQVPESTRMESGNVKVQILDITEVQHLQGVESLIQQGTIVYSFEESVPRLVEAADEIVFDFSL
ncbi:expressed unknown protein [Seminavis robusta]|uniref:Uncharacterized protein n=1 Tax=Seminavis robusta TaxID=568900 RepID=A0A9N8HNE4_9STRA|nr:expressed unknown protein [Seminavis robusta]|eukprot:Sro1203_g252050.1 n/a (190) ;mRNA; r:8012-8581